jgi:DNA gyrase/topoisomerase IV subunit B
LSDNRIHFSDNFRGDFGKFVNKIFNEKEILNPIIETQLMKKEIADRRAAKLAAKKAKKAKVVKHVAASGNKDTTLFICEGDSALGTLLQVRNPVTTGGYPLRGVVPNIWDMSRLDVMKNKELSELVSVLGLDITSGSIDPITYSKIAILTDSDYDGIGHISPLLLAFFYKFWPELYANGRVLVTRSPIMISHRVSGRGKDRWFYDMDSANDFKNKESGYHHRYIKGLASLTQEEYSKVINEPVFDKIVIDDDTVFALMFGKDVGVRKEILSW